MRLLVSGCTVTVGHWITKRPDRLGVLMTPRSGNRISFAEPSRTVWAADNDCFNGLHAPRFLRFLAKILESGSKPLWVACPDVVADAKKTMQHFAVWEPVIHSIGLPVCLVGQDGLNARDVPWDQIDGYFVGGSTAWKLSTQSFDICREAKQRGKLVHAGRVNSLNRISHFARVPVDTFDGSGFSAWGDKRIKLAIRWIDRAMNFAKRKSLFHDL